MDIYEVSNEETNKILIPNYDKRKYQLFLFPFIQSYHHPSNHVLCAFDSLESSSSSAPRFVESRRSSWVDNSWRISFSPMRTKTAILSRRWDPSRGLVASIVFNSARSALSSSMFVAYWEHFNWTAFWRMPISGRPTASFGGLFFDLCCSSCSGDKARVLSRRSSSSGRTAGRGSSGENLGMMYPSSRNSNSSRN